MAASSDAVWVSADGEPLVRVDTQRDSITRWVGNGGNAVSAGSGAVWLANNTFNQLLRIPFKALGAAR